MLVMSGVDVRTIQLLRRHITTQITLSCAHLPPAHPLEALQRLCDTEMEGAEIYQIAKNCCASVEMIEKYYAAHIKTRLDAAAINVISPHKYKSKAGNKALPKSQASSLSAEHETSV